MTYRAANSLASAKAAVRPSRRKPMEEKSRLTFRISLWRPWLLAVAMLALPAALIVALSIAGGNLAVSAGIVLGLAGVSPGLLLPKGFVVSPSRWDPDPGGGCGRKQPIAHHTP